MEKKLYLKPDTEVMDILVETALLAGTPNFGDGSDEYEIETDTPPVDAGGIH